MYLSVNRRYQFRRRDARIFAVQDLLRMNDNASDRPAERQGHLGACDGAANDPHQDRRNPDETLS